MSTLAEFVAARLNERWEQAQRNIGAAERFAATYSGTDAGAEAIVRTRDAYRSLRMIDAQRRTLARHASCGYGTGRCDDGGHGWDFDDATGPGCAELADLAAPDHEHADFDPAWKVTA